MATAEILPTDTRRVWLVAVLGVCVLLLITLAASARLPGLGEDEGLLLEYPTLIAHGEIPFRDFQSSYGPGTYLPLVAAYSVLGSSVAVERTVGAAYMALVVLAIVALLAPLGAALAGTGGCLAVLGISGAGPPTAYGWYAAAACALWAVWLARRALQTRPMRAGWEWAGSGLLVGLAVSIRPDLGAVACLAGLVLVAAGGRAPRRFWACGLCLGFLPLGLTVAAAGLTSFWANWVQARFLVQPQARLPLSSSEIVMLSLLVLGAFFLLFTAVRQLRRDGADAVARAWLALAIVGVGMLPQAFQRADSYHFTDAAPLVFGLLPWAATYGRKPSWVTTRAIAIVAVLAVGASTTISVLVGRGTAVTNAGRSFAVADRTQALDVQAVLHYVDRHSTRGQSLFVGPANLRWTLFADTWMYYLMPALQPASFYLELNPGDANRAGSRLSADLRRADVLILESVPTVTRRTLFPYARAGSEAPNDVVAHDFRIGFRAGAYSVWLARHVNG